MRTARVYSTRMEQLQESVVIDWSGCPFVEIDRERLAGVPVVKDTRMQADSVIENYEDGSPVEEIADNFDIPENVVRELIAYAARQDPGIRL
jgi:uncharacterized protein (DUF433 family)